MPIGSPILNSTVQMLLKRPIENLSGESQRCFLTGNNGRWSFLSEATFQAAKYREKQFTLERIRIRYEFNRDHAISFGKMHTPVNFWNDNFHHGRFFFPAINRPSSFGRFILVNEVGIRFSGQSPMVEGVGYDLVLGTGQSEGDDAFGHGVQSYTASFNWRPSASSKSVISYYRDTILDHEDNPFHGGHHHGGDHGDGEDMGMAEHSGLDLLEWVKSSPRIPSAMRIFACTANAGNDSLNEYERAGFNGVLTKPVDLQTLENFLSNL